MKRIDKRKVADSDCAVSETEWAHALAAGLSVCGVKGSLGQCPIVPRAGIHRTNKYKKIIQLRI